MANITQELKDTIKECDNIKEVHFAKDGNYYLHAWEVGGKKFARTKRVPKKKDGFTVSGHEEVGIPELEIIETVSRKDILSEKKEDSKEKK